MNVESLQETMRLASMANEAIRVKQEKEQEEHPYEEDDKLINLLA